MRRTDNSLPVVLVSDLAGSGSEKQHVTKLERKRAWLVHTVHMVGSLDLARSEVHVDVVAVEEMSSAAKTVSFSPLRRGQISLKNTLDTPFKLKW